MKITKKQQKEIIVKHDRLQQIKTQLKTEFFGIDDIIDDIVDMMEPWVLFGEHQQRPLTINLWGMTGVGKTSLVKRIVELLQLNEQYFRFDVGEYAGFNSLKNSLTSDITDKIDQLNNKQWILCFDEFQHARTINRIGDELDKDKLRIIWELLDSGRISVIPKVNYYNISELMKYTGMLELAIQNGLKAERGLITENKEILIKIANLYKAGRLFNWDVENYKTNDLLVPSGIYIDLLDYSGSFKNIAELEKILLGFNEQQTLDYLNKIIKDISLPKELNLSKSLIFIAGNLDEVFQMSNQLNPDEDADYFYEQTKQITIPKIKDALQKRFRNEQIARMGNNHIIYPSLNKNTYNKIIQEQLNEISNTFSSKYEICLVFTKNVNEILYLEGVFPSQGARPVLTTINTIVEANIGKIIRSVGLRYMATNKIHWDYVNEKFCIDFFRDFTLLGKENIPIRLKINSLRKQKDVHLLTNVAVHETGHAIVAALRTKVLPDEIRAVSANARTQGVCIHQLPNSYLSRRQLKDRLAIFLGGYCAEKFIFGEDNTTAGAETDILKATAIANDAIKYFGMGNEPIYVQVASPSTNQHYFNVREHQSQVKKFILDIENEVNDLLQKNKLLLLNLSKHLINNYIVKKESIKKFIVSYTAEENITENSFIEKDDYYNYSQLFEEQLTSYENTQRKKNGLKLEEIYLL